jgi:hypothetical protein
MCDNAHATQAAVFVHRNQQFNIAAVAIARGCF